MGIKSGSMENMVADTLTRFYKDKNVFLTGHTGFKGAWLLAILKTWGAKVTGYALAPDQNEHALYNVINGDKTCNSVIADIRDGSKLKEALISAQPDIIFHLAAQPLVRYAYENPIETFEVNAMGTAYLLEAVKTLPQKCSVVIVTTDKVYENKEWEYPYRETDRLGGYDPYSASKAAAEIVVDSVRNSFFNINGYNKHQKAIATARAGNVIGGGDWSADRIIPDIIRALENKNPINVRNPNAVRPWQHVLEPLFGYLLLAFKLHEDSKDFCTAWNFGPYSQDTFTVMALVNKAIAIWGEGEFAIADTKDQPHEAGLLKLDINKAINKLGWVPRFSANTSITNTIEWYKAQDKAALTYQQIKNYFSTTANGS
jgi:CDP-glucose 4,6-dehydratase